MKISINDEHNEYIALKPEEIIHELTLSDSVNWRNMTVFVHMLSFMADNIDEFKSWMDTGWMGYGKVKTQETVINCLRELGDVLGYALCKREDENSKVHSE